MKRNSQTKRSENEWQARKAEFEAMRRAYATLALLERRRAGQWQPYESIRFVREVRPVAPQRET